MGRWIVLINFSQAEHDECFPAQYCATTAKKKIGKIMEQCGESAVSIAKLII